jgi:hypothetical protein
MKSHLSMALDGFITHISHLVVGRRLFLVLLGYAAIATGQPVSAADCVPPPSGLVSWWRGENSTADAADGNNGTIAGTGTVTYGPGVVGQAFVFDGTHRDRVNLRNPTNLRLEDFTLEAWVKRSSPTVTSFDVLGADGSVSGDGAVIFGYGRGGYGFGLANNGRMFLSRIDLDGLFSVPLVTDTNWHHLAVTKSGVSAVFYVDGVAQATPAYVHPASYTFDDGTCVCSAAVSIGSRGDARGGTFFGMIDEPAVFNRALTASEIQAIYNAGSAGKCVPTPPPACVPAPTGLVSWWQGENNSVDAAGSNEGTNMGNVTGVRLGNPASLQLQTFTIELWAKRASTNRASVPLIYDNGAFLHYGDLGYGFGPHNDGRLVLTKVGVGGVYSSALRITDTNFHHVAVTKIGSSVTFYVDGVAEVAAPYDPGFVFNTPVAIGARGTDMAASFLGTIDELAVYSRALSGAEIQAIYNAGVAGKCLLSLAPIITAQPQNQTRVIGQTATFNVVATGPAPLSYQWRLGGSSLNGATNSSLVLLDVQPANAGTYSAVVSNSAGIATSSNAVLTVIPPPPCVSAASGLVGWWRGEHSTADAAGGNNGTWAGFGNTNSYGPGVVGQAFVFDGTHRDRVDLGNPTNLRLEDFTLEAWVKRSSPTVTSFDVLGADGSVSGDGAVIFGYGRGGYVFALANNGRMILSRTDLDGLISTPLVTDTNWHHLAVTKSGLDAVFYVDGVAQATPAYVHPASYTFDDGNCVCSAAVSIGSRGDARGGTFYGMIDEPAVFNRALSAGDILAIYAAGSTGKCKEPPVILTQPVSQKVTVGLNATFSVVASGTPQLRNQWRFDGDDIAGATDSTFSFTISDTSGGLYSVRVTNGFGSVLSSNALLVVNHPPVADAGATPLLFISPNGTNSPVVLNGSRSLDPDGDLLHYAWYETGVTNPVATGVVAVVMLPVGAHPLELVVNDGLATGTNAITVEVITTAQAVERLAAVVRDDVSRAQPLIATLSAALASLDRSNPTAAINQLQAFQNQLRARVMPLDPALAERFIQTAQEIVDQLIGATSSTSVGGAARFKALVRQANGKTRMQFEGAAAKLYIIEASADLVNWEKIGVATEKDMGTFEFEDTKSGTISTRFYRIVSP